MTIHKSAFTVGELCFDGVYTDTNHLFLICTTCRHWVRKLFRNSEGVHSYEIVGSECLCTCHRPSIAKIEEEMNTWAPLQPGTKS